MLLQLPTKKEQCKYASFESFFTSQVYSGNGLKEFEVEVPSGTEQTYPVITITFTAQNNVIKTTLSNQTYTRENCKLYTYEQPKQNSIFTFNSSSFELYVDGKVKPVHGQWFPLLPSYYKGKTLKNIIRLALECTSATVNVSIKYKIKEKREL